MLALLLCAALHLPAPAAGGPGSHARAAGASALGAADASALGEDDRAGTGSAPDGEPGFGPGRSARDVVRFLRSDEGRALVATWHALESDVRVQAALVLDRCRAQGYLGLLERGEDRKSTRLN